MQLWCLHDEADRINITSNAFNKTTVVINSAKQVHILYFTKTKSHGSWNQNSWGPTLHKAQTSPTIGWCCAPSDVESTQQTSAPFLLKKCFSQLLLFLASDMTRPCSSGKQNPQLATQFCSTFLSLLSMKEHSQVWSAKIGRRKNNREAVNQRNLPDAQEYCKHCLSQDKMAVCIEMIISPFNQEVHHRDQNLPGVLNVRLHHQCKMQTTVVFSSILQDL